MVAVITRCFSRLLAVLLLLITPFALAAPTTPTEDFTDNSDGTVTHRKTGLTWMRCALGMTWDGKTCTGTASKYSWNQAAALSTTFAAKTDWRLPSMAELNSIFERDALDPTVNAAVFSNTPAWPDLTYWSATSLAWDASSAWNLTFSNVFGETGGKTKSFLVRMVRGLPLNTLAQETPTIDFVANQDGTVTHLKTGLMWKRCAEGESWSGTTCTGGSVTYDWNTAVSLKSNTAGYSDWRMPNANELLTIVDYRSIPLLNTGVFPSNLYADVWSASANFAYPEMAWHVFFGSGWASSYGTFKTEAKVVRLVRSGQFFSRLGFGTQTGKALSATVSSTSLKVAGAGSAVPISIVGGSYSINGGIPTSDSGMVNPGDTVLVQLVASASHSTTKRATLTVGEISGDFAVTTTAPPDLVAPDAPGNISAIATNDNLVTLAWSAASDNVGVAFYKIFRNGALVAQVAGDTRFTDRGLGVGLTYSYRIVACDAANNCSGQSGAASATTPAVQVFVPSTPSQGFTDNGNGTVTHLRTGLSWMRCAIGQTWDGQNCAGAVTTYDWEQARLLTTTFAGNSDWRLPSIAELNGIVERSAFDPAMNEALFPGAKGIQGLWSASANARDTVNAWYLYPYYGVADGGLHYIQNSGLRTNLYAAYLVRGRSFAPTAAYTPTEDFVDNADGTVTHRKTGLMWKRCSEGQTWASPTCTGNVASFDWNTAMALRSSTAGYADWRLPTENELMTLVEYKTSNPAINSTVFPSTPADAYWDASVQFWSSSIFYKLPASAWNVQFYYGTNSGRDKSRPGAVRLVRHGQLFTQLGFPAQIGVPTGTQVTSVSLKVTEISARSTVSVVGGSYAVNGGSYTTIPGMVNPGDSVVLRVTSSATPNVTVSATLTVADTSGVFSVTTAADTQTPSVPANVSASVSAQTNKINLSWNASTDNIAVHQYRIYRNGALLAVVGNETSYIDTHLVGSLKFSYTLAACDGAGNCSPLSVAAVVTSPVASKTAPVLAAGANHSAAIKNNGSLMLWGFNESGQLGDGTAPSVRSSPHILGGKFSTIALGGSHSVAVASDGSLWAWGSSGSGQTAGVGSGNSATPLQIGTDFISVAAGNAHSVAVTENGYLWTWGNNGSGQLADGTTLSRSTPMQVGTGFYAVAAGTSHTLGIRTDGTLWAWGSNSFGQLGDGTGNDRYSPTLIGKGFAAVAAGAFHSVAVKTDGSLWVWGKNDMGQLGDNTTQNRYAPVQVGIGYSIAAGALAAGNAHSLALKSDGNLWAWGSNASGQLGDGTTPYAPIPKAIDTGFSSLAANGNHTLALRPDGTVWSWGANNSGQLGDATLASRQSAVLIVNETVDGALDLVSEVPNTIPSDKQPSFLVQVAKSSNVTSTVKYNPTDLNQSGSVYFVAYLPTDSPLLTGTASGSNSNNAKATGCPASTAGTVPAVLTRGGWKQTDCNTPTLPLYTGTLDAANNTFGMYDASKFDQTKDNGLFCVGYTGASATSAKGLIRSVVSGIDANLNTCPPVQIGSPADTNAPSIPSNLTATASGPGQVNLTWNAATDNTAVVHYNIYRGATLIATLDNVTSYVDNSPQASTFYSYSVMACDAAANCSAQSTEAQIATPAKPNVILGVGWNLVGNGGTTAMNVPSLFGDASKIYSLWKWVKTGSTQNIAYPNWAFYTPGQADSGAAYAATMGYDTFTSIASGEGFWVNAKTAFSVPMAAPAWILSSVFAPNQSKAITPGWSLIATGEAHTASAFNKAMNITPPAVGFIPLNVTSLWSWHNSDQRWYFYAPSLDASGELNAYLGEKNFLDLGSTILTPTTGFWVNKP